MPRVGKWVSTLLRVLEAAGAADPALAAFEGALTPAPGAEVGGGRAGIDAGPGPFRDTPRAPFSVIQTTA